MSEIRDRYETDAMCKKLVDMLKLFIESEDFTVIELHEAVILASRFAQRKRNNRWEADREPPKQGDE